MDAVAYSSGSSAEQITQQLEDWAKKFGGDYEINIFGSSVVVLTSVSEIRQVLNLRPSKFRRGFASVRRCRGSFMVLH